MRGALHTDPPIFEDFSKIGSQWDRIDVHENAVARKDVAERLINRASLILAVIPSVTDEDFRDHGVARPPMRRVLYRGKTVAVMIECGEQDSAIHAWQSGVWSRGEWAGATDAACLFRILRS